MSITYQDISKSDLYQQDSGSVVLTSEDVPGLIERVKQILREDNQRRIEEREKNPLDWGKPLNPEEHGLFNARYFTIKS